MSSSKPKILRHIVLFKEIHHNEKNITGFGAALIALKDKLPGILSINFSKAESAPFEGYVNRTHDYTHVLTVDFENMDALKTYGPSAGHQKAIADFVEVDVKLKCDESAYKQEGRQAQQWILIDYVNIVVHIMLPEPRKFYQLEEMWSDAVMMEHKD